ncbi:MAG: hypothetical protein M3237_04350 [Actinomycetota bacterium]|nr:hypothetical protein [Actinomycetota bacterium]
MKPRGLGVLALLATLGVGGGFGLGAVVAGQEPSRIDEAGPVPASPSVPEPTTPTLAPYGPDIDYPTLVPPTDFTRYRISNDLQTWSYLAPTGWAAYDIYDVRLPQRQIEDRGEVRFRPADEPVEGGYSLRVKVVDDHKPPATMLASKLNDLQDLTDFVVLEQTGDSLYFTYRTEQRNRLRYNFFRWFAAPGSPEATLEMSIAGREVDEVGMRGVFEQFKSGLRPLG